MLAEHVLPELHETFPQQYQIFKQDTPESHTEASTMDFLRSEGVDVIDF